MLWTVFAILLLLWLLGWGFHIAGSLIHLILVIALVVLLIEVITGRRAAVDFIRAGIGTLLVWLPPKFCFGVLYCDFTSLASFSSISLKACCKDLV
jgi:Family of unknown function (DUF5670)